MANDISYFKVEGDQTQYSFNDADAENEISEINTLLGATALPTTAQNVTGAIAEHEGDISTLNSNVAAVTNKLNGSYLPSGTNIDSLSQSQGGMWCYDRNNVTGTFPLSDTYGTIMFIPGTSTNYAVQIIRSNNSVRTSGSLYIRYRVSGTWGDWMVYSQDASWQDRTFKAFPYTEATTYSLTLPATPANGHCYMLVMKNWTSSTSFMYDLAMLTFTSATAGYVTYITQNTSAGVSSVSVSGTTVTLTFSAKKYLAIFAIRCV